MATNKAKERQTKQDEAREVIYNIVSNDQLTYKQITEQIVHWLIIRGYLRVQEVEMKWLIDHLLKQAQKSRAKAQEFEEAGSSADFLRGIELGWADTSTLIARWLEQRGKGELTDPNDVNIQ